MLTNGLLSASSLSDDDGGADAIAQDAGEPTLKYRIGFLEV